LSLVCRSGGRGIDDRRGDRIESAFGTRAKSTRRAGGAAERLRGPFGRNFRRVEDEGQHADYDPIPS